MDWWQNFLREQPTNTKSIDLVTECANLFSDHVEGLLQKIPSAATLTSLPDHDPRLTMVQTALDLLTQAAATLTELCQGPCLGNQEKLIQRHVPELCPKLLDFLTERQDALVTHSSSVAASQMSKERRMLRERRLNSFKTAELAIIQLLMAMVEGGAEQVVNQTIEALRKSKVRNVGDGINVLIANMNHHARQELMRITSKKDKLSISAKSKVAKDREGEVEATTEPILLDSNNANTINSYYILLQTLADKEKEQRASDDVSVRTVAADIRLWEPTSATRGDSTAATKAHESTEEDGKGPDFTPQRVLSEVRGVVKKIEIVRDGKSELVYFPVPKECVSQLHDGFVVDWGKGFYETLCRDNPHARVTDLVNKINKYHAVHKHQKWISNTRLDCCCNARPLYWMQKAGLFCDRWTVYNTLIINCLLIIGFTNPDETKSNLDWVNVQLYIQGFLHMWTSAVKVMVYFMQYPYLEVVKEQGDMQHYSQDHEDSLHYSRPQYWKKAAGWSKEGRLHCCARMISWRKFIFNEGFAKTVYMILCMLCSALGALVDPFFFAFHLLELFFVVQLLQVALEAVGRNGRQLFFAVAMGLILTYCYAVLGWKLIIADPDIPFEYGFGGNPDWGPNSTGVTFYDWIIIHWDMGLRDGPHGPAVWKSGGTPTQYLVLSTTYYIVIVLILGAVISGIIIDAFSADRAAKTKIEEDDRDYDFVSGLARSEFENHGIQFDDFVKQYHDPWNYLYYTVYLEEKKNEDYTGQESYVWKMIAKKDPGFFPTLRALNTIVPNSQDLGQVFSVGGGGSTSHTGVVMMKDFRRLEVSVGKSCCHTLSCSLH